MPDADRPVMGFCVRYPPRVVPGAPANTAVSGGGTLPVTEAGGECGEWEYGDFAKGEAVLASSAPGPESVEADLVDAIVDDIVNDTDTAP